MSSSGVALSAIDSSPKSEQTSKDSVSPHGGTSSHGGASSHGSSPRATSQKGASPVDGAVAAKRTVAVHKFVRNLKRRTIRAEVEQARNSSFMHRCVKKTLDPNGLWLIQHATKLHAVRFREMAREFFFQRVVARFGAHRTRRLAERAPISDLVQLALELERDEDGEFDGIDGGADPADLADPVLVARAAEAARASVAEKAPLLREYFGVDVDAASGSITGLPVLVEGFEPDLRGLPEFALALAHDVDWTEEKACFRTVADALATFYADSFDSSPETARESNDAETEETETETLETEENLTRVRAIKQFVFPAMRRCLYPSKVAAVQGVATQVASLEQLYRVFERC